MLRPNPCKRQCSRFNSAHGDITSLIPRPDCLQFSYTDITKDAINIFKYHRKGRNFSHGYKLIKEITLARKDTVFLSVNLTPGLQEQKGLLDL